MTSNVLVHGANSSTGKREEIGSTDGYMHTASPAERPGVGVARESNDITTTVVTQSFSPGLQSVDITFYQSTGTLTAGNRLFVCFDALDATDAANKLAAAGSREIVLIGETLTVSFSPGQECTRIDYRTDTAEAAGDGCVRIRGKSAS